MPTALDIAANLTGAAVTEAQEKTWFTSMRAALAEIGDPLGRHGAIQNLSLVFSVAANALTCNVKTRAGAVPSATDPVSAAIRSATAASGDFNVRNITAALSLVISSGSTLGHASATPGAIYWYLIDNAGTLELAASTAFMGPKGLVTTVAEGGAGAADSERIMYSIAARSNVPFICVGRSVDTQATAGTWAAVPSSVGLGPVAEYSSFNVLSRSSNTMLDILDWGKTVVATGTFTQTLDAAATLGDGWWLRYRNDGTGIITLDPNSTETIDGATTLKLYTGESCVITCNGSSFKTTGRSTGLVLIERKVASNQATLDFTIGIDSAFDQYIVEMSDVVLDTDGKQLAIRASTDGGSSFLSTNEYQAVTICLDGSGTVQAVNTLNLQLGMMNGVGIGNAANEFFSGTVKLYAPSGTSRHKGYAGEASYYSAGSDNVVSDRFSGIIKTTSAVNAIRFLPWPTGAFNITTGIFTLYGMRKG